MTHGRRPVRVQDTMAGQAVVRIGYDLFREVRTLLTTVSRRQTPLSPPWRCTSRCCET